MRRVPLRSVHTLGHCLLSTLKFAIFFNANRLRYQKSTVKIALTICFESGLFRKSLRGLRLIQDPAAPTFVLSYLTAKKVSLTRHHIWSDAPPYTASIRILIIFSAAKPSPYKLSISLQHTSGF